MSASVTHRERKSEINVFNGIHQSRSIFADFAERLARPAGPEPASTKRNADSAIKNTASQKCFFRSRFHDSEIGINSTRRKREEQRTSTTSAWSLTLFPNRVTFFEWEIFRYIARPEATSVGRDYFLNRTQKLRLDKGCQQDFPEFQEKIVENVFFLEFWIALSSHGRITSGMSNIRLPYMGRQVSEQEGNLTDWLHVTDREICTVEKEVNQSWNFNLKVTQNRVFWWFVYFLLVIFN